MTVQKYFCGIINTCACACKYLIVILHSLTVSNSPVLQIKYCKISAADDHMDGDHFPTQISFDKPLKPLI